MEIYFLHSEEGVSSIEAKTLYEAQGKARGLMRRLENQRGAAHARVIISKLTDIYEVSQPRPTPQGKEMK